MEKSGCIQLTQSQLDLVKAQDFCNLFSLMRIWSIESPTELKAIVDSGQYQLVETN